MSIETKSEIKRALRSYKVLSIALVIFNSVILLCWLASTESINKQNREIVREFPEKSSPYITNKQRQYPASLVRVVDGDTVDIRFSIWADIVLEKRIRIKGIDAPEMRPRKGTKEERVKEKEDAISAKIFVKQLLGDYPENMLLEVDADYPTDSFGRVLGDLILYLDEERSQTLSSFLLNSGHAKKWEK